MALDLGDLAAKMSAAMAPIFDKAWKDARGYAESEAKKMAQTLATIAELKAANKITKEQAEALVDMQKHAMQAVLTTIEGIGLIAAQNAINAALDAIKAPVNAAIGFPVL